MNVPASNEGRAFGLSRMPINLSGTAFLQKNKKQIIIGTRRSPLALAQTEIAQKRLEKIYPNHEFLLREFITQGDKKLAWSLEKAGGKGLFTAELEDALLAGTIDLAVHSGKDLPTQQRAGICIAGFLPRERANDVLVVRAGINVPATIATGSPRRRAQAAKLFPQAKFLEIRGNVATRLQKIADGLADATFLAAAGLKRLGIAQFPGVELREIKTTEIVPAAAQAAIALQCRAGDAPFFQKICSAGTTAAVAFERAFLQKLGEGCHTSFAAHFSRGRLFVFREDIGFHAIKTAAGTPKAVEKILKKLKIR